VAPKFIVSAYPKSGAPSRKGCQLPYRKSADRTGEAVVLGVEGIADFNALHSVKSMRRHRRRRRNTVDLSE
jgi:hypothetical protein